jgi:hypothetical protein
MKVLHLLFYALAILLISKLLHAAESHVPAQLEPLFNLLLLVFGAVTAIFSLILDILIAILQAIKGIIPT